MEYPFKDLMPLDEVLEREGYYRDWTHIDADAFHQISELVKFIREKGYGADTREAIAQALERVYHDAMKSGNADMELSMARKHFKDLASRLDASDQKLDSNTAQLAQTMSQTEFDSWVATLLDGGPSIFFETLTALQTAYPNGTEGVALVRETDPAKIYVWNGTNWADYGAYQGIEVKDGSITSKKIAPKSVTPETTTFATSKENLIGELVFGFGIVGGGSERGQFSTSLTNRVSYIAEVKPNTVYTVQVKGGNQFRIGSSTEYPMANTNVSRDVIWDVTGEMEKTTFDTKTNENYLVFYVTSDLDDLPTVAILQEGTEVNDKVKVDLLEHSIDGISVKNNTITPDNTTFARTGIPLSELLYGIGVAGTSESPVITTSSGTRQSYIAKVEPNKTYTFKKIGGNQFRIASTANYPESTTPIIRDIIRDATGARNEATFVTNSNENYLIFYMSNDLYNVPKSAILQEGTEIKDGVILDLQAKSIHPNKTTFATEKENLIGELVFGFGITGGDTEQGKFSTTSANRVSYIAEVKPNTVYTVQVKGGNQFRIGSSTEYPIPNTDVLRDIFWDSSGKRENLTFTTTDNENYVVIYASNDLDDLPTLSILQEGTEVDNGVKINFAKGIIKPEHTTFAGSKNKAEGIVTHNVVGNYIKETPLVYDSTDIRVGNPLENTYALWDSLIDFAPDYVTKTFMWNEPKENLPVYKYTFTPPSPIVNEDNIQFFKMLVLGNVHGHETYATLSLIHFFEDLVKNWETNDAMTMLRWNVQFDVFPVYNPYSLKYLTRVNGNGVDLNGNLTPDWQPVDELGSMFYAGPSMMSEYENQQFDAYLDNLPYVYNFAFDMHHSSSYESQDFVTYTRTLNYGVNRMLFGVANQVNAWLRKDFKGIFGTNNNHEVSLNRANGTGRVYKYFEHKGIPGALLEIAAPGEIVNPTDSVIIAQTHIGNIFLNAVKYHDQFRK